MYLIFSQVSALTNVNLTASDAATGSPISRTDVTTNQVIATADNNNNNKMPSSLNQLVSYIDRDQKTNNENKSKNGDSRINFSKKGYIYNMQRRKQIKIPYIYEDSSHENGDKDTGYIEKNDQI